MTYAYSTGRFRLIVGAIQAAALFILYFSIGSVWREPDALIFGPLLVALWFGPLILVAGATDIPRRTLASWAAIASVTAGLLAMHDIASAGQLQGFELLATEGRAGPSLAVLFWITVGIFIAQSLIGSAGADGKRVADYPTYFDITWKYGLQFALGLLFVGVLWIILALSAAMFNLLGTDFLFELFQKQWFNIPVSVAGFSAAIHLTDVQPGLIRGARTLALTLLSWLLPIITLLTTAFLIGLLFVGFDAVAENTMSPTGPMIGAGLAIIVLLNTAYQDGSTVRTMPRVLKASGTLAAIVLPFLTLAAAFGLSMRIAQYGWTGDRVIAAALIFLGAVYAVGYVAALVKTTAWLKRLELTNVIGSWVVLALLIALLSPIADPDRIGAAAQSKRLLSGEASAENFDYAYLRFDSGTYGLMALESIKQRAAGDNKDQIVAKVDAALRQTVRSGPTIAVPSDVGTSLTVYPKERSVPQDLAAFLLTDSDFNRDCLRDRRSCDLFLIDLNADAVDEALVLRANNEAPREQSSGYIYELDSNGEWSRSGFVGGSAMCTDIRQALRNGAFALQPSAGMDLNVNGERVELRRSLTPYDCAPNSEK